MWPIVGVEIIQAILKFFDTGEMYRHINCTAVTLVAKVENPTRISEYRPISCFSTINKFISKVITARLKKVVEKSSVYFGRVKQELQEEILEELQFIKGDLPFRYLGVPLSTKRISLVQCKSLLEKMLGRITSWTTKFLSYAGRAQLIKSVLFPNILSTKENHPNSESYV